MVNRTKVDLDDGEIAIWCRRTESLSASALDQMVRVLSGDEQRRQSRFMFHRDRRDYAAAHALLRHALSRCDQRRPEEWQFEVSARGKPHLHPQNDVALDFNLSHTHGLVACAIARGADVGLDVERVSRVTAARDVATGYFSAAEIQLLDTSAPHEYAMRFIELWTLKEAYMKAVGAGLHLAMDSFSFAFDRGRGLGFSAPPGLPSGEFLLVEPSSDTRLALAVLCRTPGTSSRLQFRWPDAEIGMPPRVLRSTGAFSRSATV